jgi:hypothetical protein
VDRTTLGTYDDPLDLIWREAVARLGMQIVRSGEVYASWDGRSTLTLCQPADYDADDSTAQLLLHELCHALVQGPGRRRQVDWGLDNTDDDASAVQEHACHRLQAALLDRYGLRALLGVTTDWRPYWDALPADPLADGDDPAIPLARAAWPEAVRGPWSGPVDAALRATAALAGLVRPFAPPGSLWSLTRPLHPLGEALGPTDTTCAGCAWAHVADGQHLCQHHEAAIDPTWPGCLRHEQILDAADCARCGACCREGYHVVEVAPDEPLCSAHPELLAELHSTLVVPRPGGRCCALRSASGPPWTCAVYALRPEACREFELNSHNCLEARRRVGLSRA